MRKKWPQKPELLSWWIYHKLQTTPVEQFDDPDAIKEWLIEFEKMSSRGAHLELYATYSDFRVEYVNPHYLG